MCPKLFRVGELKKPQKLVKISKVSSTFSMNLKPLFIFMSITSNTTFAVMMSPINIK